MDRDIVDEFKVSSENAKECVESTNNQRIVRTRRRRYREIQNGCMLSRWTASKVVCRSVVVRQSDHVTDVDGMRTVPKSGGRVQTRQVIAMTIVRLRAVTRMPEEQRREFECH